MLILRTPRLRLRWFTPADAAFVRRLLNDPGWIANIGDRGVRTRRQAALWIHNRLMEAYGRLGFGFWAVERLADDHLIGMCGLIKRDSLPEPDVGYALMPRYRGQGYAREAAAACLRYAREVLGFAEVWAIANPDNTASAAVLESIGLRDVGVRRLTGESRDSRVFRSPVAVLGDDRAQIDALMGRFFAAFTNRAGAIPTLAALPHYFTPCAVVRIGDARGEVAATDVHGFIAPRAELLLGGRLRQFEERETSQRTEIAGPIAQRWLRYEKRGELDGVPFEGAGTKALQFVRTPHGWKIAALAWSDDPPA
jgi:RimJ/RimL family protein N-acetyltransferase